MPVAPLSQSVDVETPELVVLSYTVAGVGSRAVAAIIDYLICIVIAVALAIGMAMLGSGFLAKGAYDKLTAAWVGAVMGLLVFALVWLYYVLFEALNDGQTPGKRMMRLRVVLDGGLAVTFEASAIRNLVRFVDLQPVFLYAVGMIALVTSSRGKRLGDMAAGTLVVKEDVTQQPLVAKTKRRQDDATPMAITARLTEPEYAMLDRFVQRRMQFDVARRTALAASIAERLADALGDDATVSSPMGALVRLHDEEQQARVRGVAARSDAGAARERHAIVAINAPRWSAFAERLKRIQSGGLKGQDETVVREFVHEYRELTSDLARLRTATRGTDSAELFYLNRLVASAHSLLYRRRTITLRRVVQFLFGDVPAEIRASFRPIALAAALLFVPMVVTARAIVVKPALASTLLPASMLARADSGVVKAKTGKGYIEDPQVLRPMMASRLVTNNVQVAFMAFAFGITAGIMTVWVLVMNGLSIGAAIGLYISKDIGHLIFGFIAPHGVFELSAIAIAGAAGLLLGAGMLIPGDRTRRAALAVNGRRAIRLVGGCAFLLIFAGAIEGFISPNATITQTAKFGVSAITAVLLVLYVFPWAPKEATAPRDSSARDIDSPRLLSLPAATRPAR